MSKPPTSIVTRTGDKGTTRLFSGEEVAKDHPRTCAYGDLDELVSLLGVAAASATISAVASRLREIQRWLFVVGTELATNAEHVERLSQRIAAPQVAEIDAWCESLEQSLTLPAGFVLPGGTLPAAHIDHARSVARRLERSVVALARQGEVRNAELGVWLNRLSDLLWLLARQEEGERVLPKDPR